MQTKNNQRVLALSALSAALLLGAGATLSGCGGKTETSASLIAEAKVFQQKGDNKAALIQLKNAVAKSPEDAEARLLLAAQYNDNGDAVSAEKELRKALSLGANADTTRAALVKALLGQGQFQKALDETAGDKTLQSPDLLVLRGDAFHGLNKPDEAKDAFDKALALKPGLVPALLGLGRNALMRRQPEQALGFIEQAIKGDPQSAEAWMFKGDFLRATGKPDEALAAYAEVVKIKPDHRTAYIETAYVLTAGGKYDQAKEALDKARKNAPQSLMLLYTQAVLDYAQNKHQAAKDSLQKILKVAPEHMPSLLLSGAVDFALGSLPQAEQHLRKYVAANPRNLHARKLLATTYLKLGQTGDAMGTLSPMLDSAGEDAQFMALVGETHMQARQFDKASEYFEKAAKLAPKAAVLRTSLAMSRLAQGDDARAVTELELSTQLDNKSSKATTMLVLTELRRKNYDKALAAVKALEEGTPNDPMVHNLKGGVYLGKGDKAAARAAFEKALVLQPTFFPAAGNLVQMAMADKNPDEARKILAAFLEKDKKNVEAMNAMAGLAMAQQKREEATTWLEKSVAENPDAANPAIILGNHYLRSGQKEKAMTLVRKATVAHPKDPQLLDLMGQVQLDSGDAQGALESFSKVAGMIPAAPQPHLRLAKVHMVLKNEGAVAEDLKKALALKPDYLEAQVAQVELLVRKGQHAQALAIAQQVQKQRPTDPAGFALEGNILRAQGKGALAVKPFEQALALRKTTPNMILLHNAMLAAGKGKEAEARLAQWHKDNSGDLALTTYVAETMLSAKQYKAAIEKLESVEKRAPGNAGVLNNLAWAYQQEKDPRALKTAEAAFKLAGSSPAVMDTYGWILVQTGDVKQGLGVLQKAVSQAPDSPEMRFHLAAALARAGDKAGARRELAQVQANKRFVETDETRALAKEL